MNKDTFVVAEEQEGERLDKLLSLIYPEQSRSFFQKLIKDKKITINGQFEKANYRVNAD